MKPYARILSEAVEGRSVIEVADQWGIPRWVLDAGLSGKINAPSTKYMPAIADGLGLSVEEFVARLYAYLSPQEAVS